MDLRGPWLRKVVNGLVLVWKWDIVTDELSSSGDSKVDDDVDKKSPKDKESKDRERDREEGLLLACWTELLRYLSVCCHHQHYHYYWPVI